MAFSKPPQVCEKPNALEAIKFLHTFPVGRHHQKLPGQQAAQFVCCSGVVLNRPPKVKPEGSCGSPVFLAGSRRGRRAPSEAGAEQEKEKVDAADVRSTPPSSPEYQGVCFIRRNGTVFFLHHHVPVFAAWNINAQYRGHRPRIMAMVALKGPCGRFSSGLPKQTRPDPVNRQGESVAKSSEKAPSSNRPKVPGPWVTRHPLVVDRATRNRQGMFWCRLQISCHPVEA